jgi:hypothetical protein
VADVIPAGWQPDPLAPTRRRFWSGVVWTARVCPAGEPPAEPADGEIAWTPRLVTLAPPVAPDAPTIEKAHPTDEAAAVALALAPDGGLPAIDPITIAFGAQTRRPDPEPATTSRTRRRLVPVAIAAAAMLVAGAAVAGAGILRSDEQRPQVLPEQAYRDDQAGFSLRYPDEWRVLRRDRGDGIRFAIGAAGAPTTETNTVSVVVGTDSASLPLLHTLADQLTEALRNQLPGVRLETAGRARLADAPGFHFAFRDPDATPATRIEQYVGRTTTGRPLTVTVTIREPRTAPTQQQVRDFVASLDPS